MPNNDLISRAALLHRLNEQAPKPTTDDLYTVNLCIINAPAVDAVPVIHAHWEAEPDNERHWHCSNCGTGQDTACIIMNYCPHCGAKMAEHPWAADGCGQAFSPD